MGDGGGDCEDGGDGDDDCEEDSGGCGAAWLCAPCIAPFVLLGAVILIGWSEKRSVCQAKAIDQGRDAAVTVGCNDISEGSGELVFFNCDLTTTDLNPSSLATSGSVFTVSFPGVCLKTTSEMYQCEETKTTTSGRRRRGSSSSSSGTTYTYQKKWSTTSPSTDSFHDPTEARTSCGLGSSVTSNPSWDSSVPMSSTEYANSAKAGAWTLTTGFGGVGCNTALDSSYVPSPAPSGWSLSGTTSTYEKKAGSSFAVGDYKVSFTGNDWGSPGVTALGKNTGGTLAKWTAESDWLCTGYTLYELNGGTQDIDALFSDLESENTGITWLLRILGLLLLWCGFFCCLGPLVFVAEMVDYIPFIGDVVSDMMYCVISAVSCMPACACCLFVTGICWMAMRPLIGVPCFLFAMLLVGCFAFASYRNQENVKNNPEKSKKGKGRKKRRSQSGQGGGGVIMGIPMGNPMDKE
jgi:hypothetical protein